MKIDSIKINGVHNPVGMEVPSLSVSWQVTQTSAARQTQAVIEISPDDTFEQLIFEKSNAALLSRGELLDFAPLPRTRYFVRVCVTADDGSTAVSDPAFFETGKMNEGWQADWISALPGDNFHPILSKTFIADRPVKRARAYVCGLGLYEIYLNNRKVGDELLAPFFNNYIDALQVSTYPLTVSRENRLDIHLGKGWYMGRFGLDGTADNYGDRMTAIAEIHLDYEDGTHEVIPTDDSWTYCGSDIEDSGIYDGEILNRLLWEGKDNPERPVCLYPENGNVQKAHLCDRRSVALRVQEILPVQRVLHTPAGETVLDMGQNFAGFMEFDSALPAGTRVVLDHGEVLQNGNFYNNNYRTAKSQFVYISDGTKEHVRPCFTYFGFRYVRVTGWPDNDFSTFRGCVVYSDMEQTGFISTGNEKINRLILNSLWGLKSNFLDMPTDCPQRDERLGWTGDAQVFAPTACYFMDARAFYAKFCHDLRAEQRRMDGGIPNYVPSFGLLAGACSVWGDVATFLPQALYTQYGDRKALEQSYEMMKDWVDYITRLDERNGRHYLYDTGFQFGDWLALDGVTSQSMKGGTDDYYIASMYYCRSAEIVSEAAAILGRHEDAAHYRELKENIRKAIFREYYTDSGRLSIDTQTAYIVALRFGIYPDKAKLLQHFHDRLRRDCYRIKGGFVGAPPLCTVLASQGMTTLAYQFLLQEDYPSWLYCVNLGATTIWERWNSLLPDGSISGTGMNSLNHYAYGSVVEFLYAYAAGIRPLAPGFARACIAPSPDIRLGSLRCQYRSVSGTYVCEWSIESDGMLDIRVEVPFNCTAEVTLPGSGKPAFTLTAGQYDYHYKPATDYRKLYTMETPLDMLAKDGRVLAILFDKVPAFGGMAAGDDPERCSITLGQLPFMHYIPHDEDKLREAIAAICDLTVEPPTMRKEEN